MVVKITDRAGKLTGKSISIDRPSGPLADTLWPQAWTSDGLGIVNIPTLEAGRQVLHSPDSANPITVDVPPLPVKEPIEISITLD